MFQKSFGPTSRMTVRPAFTLVELLIVIGVIALLISILLPALQKARKHAETIRCASNMRQIGQALEQYRNSNKDWAVPLARFYNGTWTGSSGDLDFNARWMHYLYPYTRDYRVFNCPTMNKTFGWSGQQGYQTKINHEPDRNDLGSLIPIGRSHAGFTSNYAWARGIMGIAMEPYPATSTSPYSAAFALAHGPRKFSTINKMVKEKNVNYSNVIIAMDGVYYLVSYQSTPTIQAYDIVYSKRYMHSGKRANTLFGDGRVEPLLVGEIGSASANFPMAAQPGKPSGTCGFYFKKS